MILYYRNVLSKQRKQFILNLLIYFSVYLIRRLNYPKIMHESSEVKRGAKGAKSGSKGPKGEAKGGAKGGSKAGSK